jgi:hypothetical protein
MAINPDVLKTALDELMPSYSELFVKWHPLLDKIVTGGNMDKATLKGPRRDFAVVSDGPGTVTQIETGTEIIAGGRAQNAVRGQVVAPRLIYAFDVPGKDLAEANGEMDLARIIQHYPELAMGDLHERIAKQLGTGNGTGVGGFCTLNGETTFSPDGSSRDGFFEFAAKALQTTKVHNIVKEGGTGGTSGWYNQYEDISSFATNGLSQLRKAYFAASRQGKTLGPVDLMIGDEASYLNYLEDLTDYVRVSAPVKNDNVPSNVRQGVKFLDADFFLDDSIDIAASTYTGNAGADGVIYGLKTPTWHMFTLGHDASMETKGDFALRGPFRIPEQDLYRYEIVLMMGMHTTQLRANFAVTGGATA